MRKTINAKTAITKKIPKPIPALKMPPTTSQELNTSVAMNAVIANDRLDVFILIIFIMLIDEGTVPPEIVWITPR